MKDAFVRTQRKPGALEAWMSWHARGLPIMEMSVSGRQQWARNPTHQKIRIALGNGTRLATDVLHVKNLFGSYAFGACGDHAALGRCAYYAMFRDPVKRMLSEYKWCHHDNFKDQCCTAHLGAKGTKDLDLKDWARTKGNYVVDHFRPYDTRADFTTRNPANTSWVNPIGLRQNRLKRRTTRDDLLLALNYLETDFAVVGLMDRFEESLLLFAHVLTGAVITETYTAVHRHDMRSKKPPQAEEDPETLAVIRAAVSLDLALYAAVERLYHLQVEATRAACPDVPPDADLRACLQAQYA